MAGAAPEPGKSSGKWNSQPPVSPSNGDPRRVQSATNFGAVQNAAGSQGNDDSAVGRRLSGRRDRPARKRSMLDAVVAERTAVGSVPGERGLADVTLEDQSSDAVWRRARRDDGYRFGESRFPLLQTTVDELAALGEDSDGLDSAFSSMTDMKNSFTSSIAASSSPVTIPATSSRGQSLRMKPPQILGSPPSTSYSAMRRSIREASGRSGSASWSPAGQFLSQFGRGDDAAQPKPDDEGQELGDNSEYVIGKQVGHGGFSVVKEVHTFERGARVTHAVKIVRKQIEGQSEQDNETAQNEFDREVTTWRFLKHPNILPLITVFDTSFATFCITKLTTGGTLFDVVLHYRRQASKSGSPTSSMRPRTESNLSQISDSGSGVRSPMPLSMAKRYIYQLASALRYLHQDVRIIHHDVKLENCLVNTSTPLNASVASFSSVSSMENAGTRPSETNPGNILLSDFGMSDFISKDERSSRPMSRDSSHSPERPGGLEPRRISTPNIGPGPNSSTSVNIAGSLPYASPEQLHCQDPIYLPSVDIWAFGVTCYALLVGQLPFKHTASHKLVQLIQEGKWSSEVVRSAVRSHATTREQLEPHRTGDDLDDDNNVIDALALLDGCLHVDVNKRWDIGEVLECRFLRGGEARYGVGSGV